MLKRPTTFRPRGGTSAEARKQHDAERGSAASRGYDWRWSKAAKAHLAANPLCVYCRLHGCVTIATLVDHLYPHRGDMVLFWRADLWISSCKGCHDGFKKALEMQGLSAVDELARRLGIVPLDRASQGGGG